MGSVKEPQSRRRAHGRFRLRVWTRERISAKRIPRAHFASDPPGQLAAAERRGHLKEPLKVAARQGIPRPKGPCGVGEMDAATAGCPDRDDDVNNSGSCAAVDGSPVHCRCV